MENNKKTLRKTIHMSFDLNYTTKGSGTPFIFQHGLGANLQQAQGLMARVGNVQLISMDCPGHGESPLRTDQLPSFDNYVDNVIRLMDYLGIESAVFGGISMGSGISLNMAINHPERVKGLVLVRPAWLDQSHPDNLDILLKVGTRILQRNGKAEFEALPEFKEIQAAIPGAANSIIGLFSRKQLASVPIILKQMVMDAPFADLNDLAQINVPAVIIANEHDPLHPFDMAKIIHQYIPQSKLHKVTSRYVNDSLHREEVSQIVTDFLEWFFPLTILKTDDS